MSIYTRIHDRKKKQKKQAEQEQQATLERALKRCGLNTTVSPERTKVALRKYVSDLEGLRQEMKAEFIDLPGIREAIQRIDVEISRALKQLAENEIEQLKS